MVEQVKMFQDTTWANVNTQYNNWMVENDNKVKKVIEFERFTEYLYHNDKPEIPVDESVKVYTIFIRYESSLTALNTS
jgi:hypothetical protein